MRNRSLDIDHPGIPGHANRWFPNAGTARRAALIAANAYGLGATIAHDAHPARGLPHYHVVNANRVRLSGHYFYGRRPPRRVLRDRPNRELEFEVANESEAGETAGDWIIDGHCHAGKGDRMTAPWNTEAPLEKYLRRARAAGIHRTVIIPAGHSNYSEANRQIARIVARQPDRFIGFASLHAQRDAGKVSNLVRTAVTKLGLCGLKVHAYDATPTREVCEAALAFRVPMLVDVVGRAYLVELFAAQFPDVNFIIPHLGSFMDDWRAQQQVVESWSASPMSSQTLQV